MVATRSELSLSRISNEQNNRFDQKRYLSEEKFSKFISSFEEVEPLSKYIESIRNGQDFKTDYYSQVETDVLYISVNQISSGILGKLYWDDITYLDVEDDEIEIEADVNDILITRSGSYPGIAWRASEAYLNDYRIVPSGFVQRLRLKEDVDVEPAFITAYLNSPPVKMLTQACACGKEQLNISQEYIKSIPVPTLSESKRRAVTEGVSGFQRRIQELQNLVEQMRVRQGTSTVDILSGNGIEDITLPEIPELPIESDSETTEDWGLPTRRGQKESTFYVSSD